MSVGSEKVLARQVSESQMVFWEMTPYAKLNNGLPHSQKSHAGIAKLGQRR